MKTAWFPWSSYATSATWGTACWLLLLTQEPADLHSDYWARLLLQLAMLVWVPLGLSLLTNLPGYLRFLLFPAAISALVSLQLAPGGAAAILALPWLAVTGILFVSGLELLFWAGRQYDQWALAGARIFILIGGLSLLADRSAWQPLDFDPAIILLTAVHFHYAGFIFLLLLGLGAEYFPGRLFRWAAGLALASVPLTAAGITLAQTTRWFGLEVVAAAIVAGAGWLGAWAYLQLAFRQSLPPLVRFCWAALALCLIFSMSLGLGYALRPYFPIEMLNIPAMRAWHGTVNGLGLAGCGLVGWKFLLQTRFKTNGCN